MRILLSRILVFLLIPCLLVEAGGSGLVKSETFTALPEIRDALHEPLFGSQALQEHPVIATFLGWQGVRQILAPLRQLAETVRPHARETLFLSAIAVGFSVLLVLASRALSPWTARHPAGVLWIFLPIGIGRVGVSTFVVHRIEIHRQKQSSPFDWNVFKRFSVMSFLFGTPVITFLIFGILFPRIPSLWGRGVVYIVLSLLVLESLAFYVKHRSVDRLGPLEAAQAMSASMQEAGAVQTVLMCAVVIAATSMPSPLYYATVISIGIVLNNIILLKGSRISKMLLEANKFPPFFVDELCIPPLASP